MICLNIEEFGHWLVGWKYDPWSDPILNIVTDWMVEKMTPEVTPYWILLLIG